MRTLFILRKDDILPLVVILPPSSLKVARKFFLRLASQGVPYYGVVVEITLEKDKSETGITYSKANLTLKSRLDAETIKKLKEVQNTFKPAFMAVTVNEHPEEAESEFPKDSQSK